MMLVLVIVAIGMAVVLGVAPLLLPWPQHLRWLVACTALPADPWSVTTGMAPAGCLDEVIVGEVEPRVARLVEVGAKTTDHAEQLSLSAASPDDLARLQRWAASGTPLLRITDPSGEVSLHGPAHAVIGLRKMATDAGTPDSRFDGSTGRCPSLGDLALADPDLFGLRSSSASRVRPDVR